MAALLAQTKEYVGFGEEEREKELNSMIDADTKDHFRKK
jgi:hypothetical protein